MGRFVQDLILENLTIDATAIHFHRRPINDLTRISVVWKNLDSINILNPYWQILENSSRNFSKIFIFWVVTQAVLLENSSSFFSKFKFWGVTQAVLLENSSIKNHGYLFSFVQFWGVTQAVLLENSSIKNHGHLFSFFLILGRHTGRFTGKFIHSNFDWNLIGYVAWFNNCYSYSWKSWMWRHVMIIWVGRITTIYICIKTLSDIYHRSINLHGCSNLFYP